MSAAKFLFATAVTLIFTLGNLTAHATGKKRREDPVDPPVSTSPHPVRKVVIRPVGTKVFTLPNGATVDLSADLETLLTTSVASTTSFAPTDETEDPLCDVQLEIRAAVSTLDLEATKVGVTFGYSPSGSKEVPVTNLEGAAEVKVGTIAMDFAVYECQAGSCSSTAATYATHLTAGVDLKFTVDFDKATTGANFIHNSPLGGIIRKVMAKGMNELSASARLNELSWRASVKHVDNDGGYFIFDAGTTERLGVNQTFVVYSATDAGGECDLFRAVAYGHTTQVDTISSVAVIDQTLDSRGVQVGDVVLVR